MFGGACKICPWGAMADVVQAAMKPYGYDVRICYNCNAAEAPPIVSEARLPPPYKPDPAVPEILAPRNAPGLGPIDFGAVAVQFLRSAYRGTGVYANEKPRTNLRLIANIQDPSYVLVAAKAETGIGSNASAILAHFGLSREAIQAAGGRVGNAPEDRENIIGAEGRTGARHHPGWPASGGVRPIPTVVRTGTAVYCRADTPDDFAYMAAKAMDEQQELLQWKHLNFSYNVHSVWKACEVPLHPGAARHYK